MITALLVSCASWKSTTRTALDMVSRTGVIATQAITVACDNVLLDCKAQQMNPCPELIRCHSTEREIIRGSLASQTAALFGYAALDTSDRPTAAKMLKEAIRLLAPVKVTLAVYGINLQ